MLFYYPMIWMAFRTWYFYTPSIYQNLSISESRSDLKANHQGNRFPLGHLVNLVSVTARLRPLRWPRTCSKAPGWWFTQNASEHTIASTFLATEFGLCKQDRGAQENNSASRAYLYSLILVKFLSFRCAMVCPSSSMNDSGDAARFARWKAV